MTFTSKYTIIFYNLVSQANLAISAAEEVAWSSEADKTQTLAEAHFFRAYAI